MKSIWILILSILINFTAVAQNNTISNTTLKQHYTVTATNNVSNDAAEIINLLAIGNNKTPRNVLIIIDFNQTITSNLREPTIVSKITSTSLKLTGDVFYKGFNLSEYIFPAVMNFSAQLNSLSGVKGTFPLSTQIFNGIPENTSINFNDSNRIIVNISLINHSFRFGNTVISNFKNQCNLIDNYYESASQLDRAFMLLQGINLNDIESYRVNSGRLIEAENIIGNVRNKNISQQLNLSQNDPINFNKKLTTCINYALTTRNDFNYLMTNLHITFLQKGISFVQVGNLNKAERYFKMSLDVNPLFAPALFQLALLDYRRNDLRETVCKADDILYSLYPDPDTKQRTLDLLQDVYEAHLELGNQQLSQKKNYFKAIDQFEDARRICEKYKAVRCLNEMYEGIKLAKFGIYRSHLEDARLLIQSNNLDKAETTVNNAIIYQFQNRDEIQDNSEAIALQKAIRQKRYNALIIKAKSFIDQRLYDAALTTFNDAADIQREYELKEEVDLKDLISSAARPRIIELFYEGEALVKLNDINAASNRYKLGSDLQLKYNFLNDKDISKHKESLRKSIYTQECINAQQSFDNDFNDGQNKAMTGDYLAAEMSYEKALSTAQNFKDCQIETTALESANLSIRPAATYLKLMNDFYAEQENGNYKDAIDLYNKSTRYFMEMKVASFGLNHELDKFTFIKEKAKNGLVNYAAQMYTDQDDLDKGLILYKLLLSRNYDVKLLEGSLYTLGFKFGQKEKISNPGFKAKELVKQYTSNDKKMKRFEKGFSKGYK